MSCFAPEILLLLPPGAQYIRHPEVGPAQLQAHLQSLGIPTALRDLNTEFVYDYLARPEVLARIHDSIESFVVREDSESERWYHALVRFCEHHSVYGTSRGLAIRDFITEQRAARGFLSPPDSLSNVRYDASDSFTALCLEDGLFWASFVETLHFLLFSPRSHEVEDVLAFAEHLPPLLEDFLVDRLDDFSDGQPPRIVGLSLGSTAQVPIAMGLSRLLRRRWPKLTVVAGGAWSTGAESLLPTFPEVFDDFDAIVVGQGDDALADCYRRIRENRELEGIDNVVVRKNGRVYLPRGRRSRGILDSAPASFEGLNLSLYPKSNLLPVRLQSGCLWQKCSFCSHVVGEGHHPHHDDPERLVARTIEHIRNLQKTWGCSEIFLLDHAVPLHLMERFARKIIDERIQIQWVALARFEHGFHQADVEVLAQSGCIELQFGLESTDPRWLKKMNKGIDLELVDLVLDKVHAARIPAIAFLMHLPGQTLCDVQRDMAWAHERHDKIERFTIARFDLARGSLAYRHPELVGVSLEPGLERNIDVFSMRYKSHGPMLAMLELMKAYGKGAEEHGTLRGEQRDFLVSLSSTDRRSRLDEAQNPLSSMAEITDLRERIDAVDDVLLERLSERVRVAQRLGALKKQMGKAIADPGREQQVLRRWQERALAEGLDQAGVEEIALEVIGLCRNAQVSEESMEIGSTEKLVERLRPILDKLRTSGAILRVLHEKVEVEVADEKQKSGKLKLVFTPEGAHTPFFRKVDGVQVSYVGQRSPRLDTLLRFVLQGLELLR